MKRSDIWIAIEEKKVFQIWEIVEELMKEWGFFGRAFVKERVKSAVRYWLSCGLLKKVNDEPLIFALKDYADRWQDFATAKVCLVCGKKFFPKRGSQELYCSRKCYAKRKYEKNKEKLKKGARSYYRSLDKVAVRKGLPWTEEEDEFLLQNRGKLTYREIAQKLGRTVEAVAYRAKKLLREASRAN